MQPPFKVVGIGEVLWDLFPSGPLLGGAPANFASHAAALGADASVVSRVGQDPLGEAALGELRRRGLDIGGIGVDRALATGTVTVTVEPGGNPRFAIAEPSAWDALQADESSRDRVRAAAAVCFGSLAQRTRNGFEAIQSLVASTRPDALRVFDINLRPPFLSREVTTRSLQAASILKLNEWELPVVAGWYGLSGSIESQLAALARRFELEAILLTLGAAGSRLWREGRCLDQPARPVEVKDAVGAGDAFTAAFVLGWLRGWASAEQLRVATEVAAFVCTQSGAVPRLPEALVRPFGAVAPVDVTRSPEEPSSGDRGAIQKPL